MTDKPAHLCLTCNLAEWHRTDNGRLHPNGEGKCGWKPIHIPTPAAWRWGNGSTKQPIPEWGWIDHRPYRPIAECETYEEKS